MWWNCRTAAPPANSRRWPLPPVRLHRVGRLLSLLIALLGVGCGPTPPPPGPLALHFYHWERTLEPDSTARRLLTDASPGPLFTKVFDVVWEEGRPTPRAILRIGDTTDLPPLLPVVFLTNEVMQRLSPATTEPLIQDIRGLVDRTLAGRRRAPGIQFDCDWTATTRATYFTFLETARAYFPSVSCTVRLHQYRDRSVQGVPPVDRGVLMAYNTGELDDWNTDNSILDTAIVAGYLRGQPTYPLPLDIAVAVYDWMAVYRRDRLAYLINEPPLDELTDTTRFRTVTSARYTVERSTYYDGIYLYRGDQLRYEAVPPTDYRRTAEFVRRLIGPTSDQRLLVYRLGSRLWR